MANICIGEEGRHFRPETVFEYGLLRVLESMVLKVSRS